ncbi:alpha/beta fold hydrolase [Nocardiopsis quinghaiensis]|uniref:alpha/beta fold hydrolase n=1 Tax=Nocardiopsis quinghaiensis TaxID=464995 RepID=UPI00123BA552|nr:alpha/beta fold hydrolase [Nocardiopsis quinghaiensis]
MTAPLLPPGARVGHVPLCGGSVRVLRGGSPERPTLLLVHGGGSDNAAISWYRLFAPLSREYRVVAPDLPGFGGTTGIDPVGGPERQADFVAALASELGLADVVAVGVSMGGDTVLNLALRHPRLVRGLVLIAPGGLVPALPDRILLPATRLANRFVGTALRMVVRDVSALPDEVVSEFRREALRAEAGLGYLRYNQATIGPRAMRNNLLPLVERITAPALFFHGRNDPLVPPEGSREAVRRMPDARLALVPDCGHWAQLEAHDRFLEELTDFLSGPEA